MDILFNKPNLLRLGLNIWPPFFFTGIKLARLDADYRYARTELKWRPWLLNANRTQYGGSMFSMTDPVYSILLMGALGSKYHVWDSYADINFVKPGKGKLIAEFIINDAIVDKIKQETSSGDKYFPEFTVHIKDETGELICEVKKRLYVRLKRQARPDSN